MCYCLDSSFPAPNISLPTDVLSSIVQIFLSLPSLSLYNLKAVSSLSKSCLSQGREFISWMLSTSSGVDDTCKRYALEISLLLTLHEGSLSSFINWISSCLNSLSSYTDGDGLCISHEICNFVFKEIHKQSAVSYHLLSLPVKYIM